MKQPELFIILSHSISPTWKNPESELYRLIRSTLGFSCFLHNTSRFAIVQTLHKLTNTIILFPLLSPVAAKSPIWTGPNDKTLNQDTSEALSSMATMSSKSSLAYEVMHQKTWEKKLSMLIMMNFVHMFSSRIRNMQYASMSYSRVYCF